MPSNKKVIAVRTTDKIISKFSYICDRENRSMSKQAEKMIIDLINEYEKQNGPICTSEKDI